MDCDLPLQKNASAQKAWRPETVAIHGGYRPDAATRSVVPPICQTVAYAFDSAEHAAALFNLEADGFRYSRISNPTVEVLEQRLALLEGGEAALAVSSGQAALYYTFLNLAQTGGNIVSVPQIYGTTHTLLAHLLPQMGMHVRFAQSDNPDDVAALIDEQTCAVFCESVGNPAGNICDIERLAEGAHQRGVPLVVDNTVATPILLRPIEYGADVVVHSLTKYLGGHGTTMGGVIVDAGHFDWRSRAERFPQFSTPDVSYHGMVYAERYGRAAFIARCRSVYLRTTGAILPALSAFLLLQGLETIAVRMDRHLENARKVDAFLQNHPSVSWVNYAGAVDSPYHALCHKYLNGRACALIGFGHAGGYAAAADFYDRLQLILRVVNIGDVRSLACHPASTTHRQMPAEDQLKAGVRPEMIRLSIGIENADDIIADLEQALTPGMQAQSRPIEAVYDSRGNPAF